MFRYLLRCCLFLTLPLFIGINLVMAQDAPQPDPVGQRPDAPMYALHGPYWVGTRTMELDAGTENAVRFTVWYPAVNPNGLEEAVTYVLSANHTVRTDYGVSPDAPFTVLGHALSDAAPDLSGAPYSLVINSHAFTAQMWQMYLGEHLASYGFVVMAPEHSHDSFDNVYTDSVIRILEVTRLIDYADALTAAGGELTGMIDSDRVAVGGHSAGGMISYGAAGAPMHWASVLDFCQSAPDAPDCADLEGQFSQIQALLETTISPDEMVPIITNSRVDAIFPMAGTIEIYGEAGLASLTVPMLSLFGSNDPYDWMMSPAYDAINSTEKAQVVFLEGGHALFYNQCEAFPWLVENGLYWGCSDTVWDMARAQDLTNCFVTAFLLDTLNGDADAHAALMPEAVDFPGIEYTSTMH